MSEPDKDVEALKAMRRARRDFEDKICAASTTQDEEVLRGLRFDTMFEFAEFYYTIEVMGLKEPGDITLIAERHNNHIAALSEDRQAQRRRGLTRDRLLKAIFTADTWPKMEAIWREQPGALDLSTLARFLVCQMSQQTTRNLCTAAVEAGFMTRAPHAFGSVVVVSTGVMEHIFGTCMREMRLAIARL